MRPIDSFWYFDPATTALLVTVSAAYLYAVRLRFKKQSLYFLAGMVLLVTAMASPLHFLGEHYLFSAQMVSHILIVLLAAPLLVAGIPAENQFKRGLLLWSKKMEQIPVVNWLTGVGIMWFWHIPFIFNHFSGMGFFMTAHMLSLLVAGMIFCWPVISPYVQYRLTPPAGVLYLSTACAGCSLLGLLITFAPPGIFTHYQNLTDMYGYLPLVRNGWNISAAADQQMAGLIMWVPGCFIYLSAAMILLIKWFNTGFSGYTRYRKA